MIGLEKKGDGNIFWNKNKVPQEVSRLPTPEEIVSLINEFQISKKNRDMHMGIKYFDGKHDILKRKRTIIGADGELQEIRNVPNNKVVDNQYKKIACQKNNYLLGKPLTFTTVSDDYHDLLNGFFDKKFMRLLKNIGEDSLNCGLGWLYVHYNEQGNLAFQRFRPTNVIPSWADDDHTILNYAIRFYQIYTDKETFVEKVELYGKEGVYFYERELHGQLQPSSPSFAPYVMINDLGYGWEKIPLIPFKYNDSEQSLLKNVKSLQDGLNSIISNFQNFMEEDQRNTIMVLVNYDGENLGEFRSNLSTYGAVKVGSGGGDGGGDVKTLQVEVNSENYRTILKMFKDALIENAMGFDSKDTRLNESPNEMNIQSMYSDIDLDANNTETEYQVALEEVLWFVDCHIQNTYRFDFFNEPVNFIFNRDILMNEADIIANCKMSVGLLSDETIIANHPWTDDPRKEIERIKNENQEIDVYDELGAEHEEL